jgi:ribonuclease HI
VIEVHFDGLCDPNPGGIATFGFLVRADGKLLHEAWGPACPPRDPGATNNVAEYTGLLRALEWLVAQKMTAGPVLVRGDSDLVIRQMKGEWKVKDPALGRLFAKARELAFRFPSLRFEWVPRERNTDADALTNRAFREARRGK